MGSLFRWGFLCLPFGQRPDRLKELGFEPEASGRGGDFNTTSLSGDKCDNRAGLYDWDFYTCHAARDLMASRSWGSSLRPPACETT